jgi:dihydroorotase
MNTLSQQQYIESITINYPDDWHLHLRDGSMLASVVTHSASRFARAIIMPNLKPPITNTIQALAYKNRILAVLPHHTKFVPLMTLYLTEDLTIQELHRAVASNCIHGIKLYPAGVTTNSEAGINSLTDIYPILDALQTLAMPLLVHAEVSNSDVDIFDRERVFIERYLIPITKQFPELRLVVEHITTKEAVEFVENSNSNVAATITAHHLLYNRNAMLTGCIRPHFYCLPILKREVHRQALLKAATSNNPKFFLGTDSAPHAISDKECDCGCAGCFTAHAAIELYAEAFEQAGKLSQLEAFASWYGADFYHLPRNQAQITLHKVAWQVPPFYSTGNNCIVPLRANTTMAWQLANIESKDL